ATITATTPAHAAGAVDVGSVSGGGTSNLHQGFVYAIAPTITGISPGFGDIGGYDMVTITGTDLIYGTDVTFDGVPASSVQVAQDGRSASVYTPAHAVGLADVAVVSGSGSATLPGAFD